ncbi:hypothetical protein BDN70DRAFT_528410 [Pholiota conissans]|uniref:Uncharacterized protein n=1 Tax=Pholiota conissans TaxID=109636 RepID=A0A9P5Z5G8_9AGAR|nr:hypothetical protein BDN70DRAFT_528410 [Pholiota conissans]
MDTIVATSVTFDKPGLSLFALCPSLSLRFQVFAIFFGQFRPFARLAGFLFFPSPTLRLLYLNLPSSLPIFTYILHCGTSRKEYRNKFTNSQHKNLWQLQKPSLFKYIHQH